MTPDDKSLKALALAWKKAAPRLRAQRHADIRKQDNAKAIDSLNDLFRQTIANRKPRKTSGFVKMYEVLKRHYNV